MSLTSVTASFRQQVQNLLDSAQQAIGSTYQRMVSSVQSKLSSFFSRYSVEQQQADDGTVPLSWLHQSSQLLDIEHVIEGAVSQFADSSTETIGATQHRSSQLGITAAVAQLQEATDETAVKPSGKPSVRDATGYFDDLASRVADTVKLAITNGVTLGKSADDLSDEVTQKLGEANWRAQTVATTDGMDAFRTTQLDTYGANGVQRYRWTSLKGSRTCIACLMMDGTILDSADLMRSHANCSCLAMPVTEDMPDLQTGEEWFNAQDEETQRQILGPAKYAAWQAGKFELADLVGRTERGIYEKPLKEVVAGTFQAKAAAQKKQRQEAGAPTAIRTPEQEAQVRAIEQELSRLFPHTVFSFEGTDPALMRQVADQLKELFTRFPDVAATIPYIGTGKNAPKGYDTEGLTGFAGAQSHRRGTEAFTPIFLNADYFGNPEKMRTAYDLSEKTDWFTPNGYSVKATITHEFGHVIRFFLEQNGMGQEVNGQEVSSFVEQFLRENAALGDKISGYAKSGGIEEHFAEAFASLNFSAHQQQATYTKLFGEMLQRVLPGGIPIWQKDITPAHASFSTAFAQAKLTPFGDGTTYKVTIGGNDFFAKPLAQEELAKELLARQFAITLGVADRVTPSYSVERGGQTYLVQSWLSNGKPLAEVAAQNQDVPFHAATPEDLTRMQLFEYVVQDNQRNTGNYFLDKTAGKLLEVGFTGMGQAETALNTQSALTSYLVRNQASLTPSVLKQVAGELDALQSSVEQAGVFDETAKQALAKRIAVIKALAKLKNPSIQDWQNVATKMA